MRRVLPLSAILSGLLASPAFAGPPAAPAAPAQQTAPAAGPAAPGAADATVQPLVVPGAQALAPEWRQPFPGDMPRELRAQLQQFIDGRPLDANGMQELQRRMAQDMHDHLQRMMVAVPGQIPMPGAGPTALQIADAPAQLEKAAFLGVSTSAVSPSLRQQLKLPRGIGLVVDFVDKDSPAAAAGVKLYDILEKLDDQILINPQQLAVLVRTRKPGDAVNLSIIREGQRLTITAKLAEKDMPALDNLIGDNQFMQISPVLPRITELNPGGLMQIAPENGQVLQVVPGDLGWQKSVRISITTDADGGTTRTLIDDRHELTLTTGKDGKTTLTAKDRAGNPLYQGPYESGGKNDKIPADILDEVHSLEKTGLTPLHSGPAAGPQTMTLTRADADHEITLRIDSRGRRLTVKDRKSGKMLFDGPANTPEDLKGLPQPVIEKVHALADKAAPQ